MIMMNQKGIISKLAFAVALVQICACSVNASDAPSFPIAKNYEVKSIFVTFAEMLERFKPLNLGTGVPDNPPPAILSDALAVAAKSQDFTMSQYAPYDGQARLRKAVAKFYGKQLNRTLNPYDNVITTVGGSEALFDTFQAFTTPGDEWIIIEPFFEPYEPMIKAARGVPRFIALKPKTEKGRFTTSDWSFDRVELANLFNKKTKAIIVNSPNNPTGKMFNLEELTFIADLAKKWNTLVVFDEVYEHLPYEDNEHIRMATLPGMFERTISIGSAGKIFSATGYKVGWAYGHKALIDNIKTSHYLNVRNLATPLQEAVAVALETEIANYGNPKSYLSSFRRESEEKRQYLADMLSSIGMTPIMPQGGYFLLANVTELSQKAGPLNVEDTTGIFTYVEWLMREVGVTGMPLEGFYSKASRHVGKGGVRFTIIKKWDTLEAAETILNKWKSEH